MWSSRMAEKNVSCALAWLIPVNAISAGLTLAEEEEKIVEEAVDLGWAETVTTGKTNVKTIRPVASSEDAATEDDARVFHLCQFTVLELTRDI
jgi:hypothetical protein